MRCFVISPIGQPGSDTRKHADDVFECIIEPALKAAEIEGRRADHINDVGRVTRQMYDDILQADFCVALLHGFNPNVFYELAIAHSAGIPVILLSQLGIDPPFDIKDERVFSYDLSPRAIYHGDNVKRLAGMIDSVRKLGGKREVPFGHNLTPLNAATAALDYVLRTETNAQADEWLKLVRQARKRLYLGGIAFGGWRGIQGHERGPWRVRRLRLRGPHHDHGPAESGFCHHDESRYQYGRAVHASRARTGVVSRGIGKRSQRRGPLDQEGHAVSADHHLRRPDAGVALSVLGQYRIQPAPRHQGELAGSRRLPA
jgi:hypothetical protein